MLCVSRRDSHKNIYASRLDLCDNEHTQSRLDSYKICVGLGVFRRPVT